MGATEEQIALVALVKQLTKEGKIRWRQPRTKEYDNHPRKDGCEVEMIPLRRDAKVFFKMMHWGGDNGPSLFIYSDSNYQKFVERIDDCKILCVEILDSIINFWEKVDHFVKTGYIVPKRYGVASVEDLVGRGKITEEELEALAEQERSDQESVARAAAIQKALEKKERRERFEEAEKRRVEEHKKEQAKLKQKLNEILDYTKKQYC